MTQYYFSIHQISHKLPYIGHVCYHPVLLRSENLQYMVAIFPQTLYLFEYNLWGMMSLFIALVIHSVDHIPVDCLLIGNISKVLCLFECDLWDCLLMDFCTAWFSSCSHSAVPWLPSACRHHSIQNAYRWYSYSVHIIYHLYYNFNKKFEWFKNGVHVISQLYFTLIRLFKWL